MFAYHATNKKLEVLNPELKFKEVDALVSFAALAMAMAMKKVP